MARKQASKRLPAHVKAKAEKTLENLREHYDRGQEAIELLETMRAREVAEELATNPHTLRKERRFAELYSERDFERLCRLRRSDGTPLRWGHVLFLITVSDRKLRLDFQRQAVENNRSAKEPSGWFRITRVAAARGTGDVCVRD